MRNNNHAKGVHDIAIEQIVLGWILGSGGERIHRVMRLEPQDFYEPLHGLLFGLMKTMALKGEETTPVTLNPYLIGNPTYETMGEGKYLIQLVTASAGVLNINTYVDILRDLKHRRQVSEFLDKYQGNINLNTDLEELKKTFEEMVHQPSLDYELVKESDLVSEICLDLLKDLPCFSTGFNRFDKAMGGGWYTQKLYVFGAPQKAGKTVMFGTFSKFLSEQGVPHAYYALEMNPKEILHRTIARVIGKNAMAFLNPNIRKSDEFQAEVGSYAATFKGSAWWCKAPSIPFDALKSSIIYNVRKYKLKGIFIDYLQLITGMNKGESRVEFQDRIAQWLGEIARREDIFVACLVQLNKEGSVRGGEGVKNAVDQLYIMHKKAGLIKDDKMRWFSCDESRYTPKARLGDEFAPTFKIDTKTGPSLVELDPEFNDDETDED